MKNTTHRKLEKCLRCGYSWFTRKSTQPKVCARCRSPYWNTPKNRKAKDIAGRLAELKRTVAS